MFKGRSSSGGGSSARGSAASGGDTGPVSRSLLLDTSFRFHSGQDDVEGIVGGICLGSSPAVSPTVTVVPPFANHTPSDSPTSTEPVPATTHPLAEDDTRAAGDLLDDTPWTTVGLPSLNEGNGGGSLDSAVAAAAAVAAAGGCSSSSSSSLTCSAAGPASRSQKAAAQRKSSPPPPPPPPPPTPGTHPSTPQHSAVKELVSRLRKQVPKDQKNKENLALNDKDKKDLGAGAEPSKENNSRSKETGYRDSNLKEVDDGKSDRDSRSPSPGGDSRAESVVKATNKDGKEKDPLPSQDSRDASWFGGIKGKIVKKFEEKRARSQSVPIVAKTGQASSVVPGATEATASETALPFIPSPSGASIDYDDIERAEEADPERMALEQGLIDSGLGSEVPLEINEDDSWEKVELPPRDGHDHLKRIFYRDFASVKARWITLDSAYIAARFPNVIEEMRTLLISTIGVFVPVLLAFFVLPLPGFVKGFLIASLLWYTLWKLAAALCPAAPTERGYYLPVQDPQPSMPTVQGPTKAPPSLLMPRLSEMSEREGWLNALPVGESYDVRTHLGSHSHSVHIRLVGTTLRIRTPKEKLPRRAMWDERKRDTSSVAWLGKQWFIELDGATVRLQPEGLPATRLWNKKYPIVVNAPARSGEEVKDVVLFARTCRDKEYWFRVLRIAAGYSGATHPTLLPRSGLDKDKPTVAVDDEGTDKLTEEATGPKRCPVDFFVYMNNLGLSQAGGSGSVGMPASVGPGSGPAEDRKQHPTSSISCCPSLTLPFQGVETQWLNVVIGRLLFDFFTQPQWADAVRAKFQKKLSKIKVPFFMEELTITDIDLGARIPLIRRTSAAVHCPDTGVWLDLEIAYNGCFQVTVNTKLNLMKLKKQGGSLVLPEVREQEMQELTGNEARPNYDDIPSEDDDDDTSEGTNQQRGEAVLEEAQGATSKKILDMVDRISQWSVFQQATDNAFIRKKMEELSNTDLKLTIQLSSLVGRLAINIPPPPTDRLWYGFRSVPRLEFKAIPQLGEREVSFRVKLAAIIERALFQEFQRVLVMPNMDDLQIDLMESQPL